MTCPQATHAGNCIFKWRSWGLGSLVIQASTTVQTSSKYETLPLIFTQISVVFNFVCPKCGAYSRAVLINDVT